MKKISLKRLDLQDVEHLSREQLKNLIGGVSLSTSSYMCCPDSIASGIGCSSCVQVGPNESASCEMGILVAC